VFGNGTAAFVALRLKLVGSIAYGCLGPDSESRNLRGIGSNLRNVQTSSVPLNKISIINKCNIPPHLKYCRSYPNPKLNCRLITKLSLAGIYMQGVRQNAAFCTAWSIMKYEIISKF
jgi:hypothetical protein